MQLPAITTSIDELLYQKDAIRSTGYVCFRSNHRRVAVVIISCCLLWWMNLLFSAQPWLWFCKSVTLTQGLSSLFTSKWCGGCSAEIRWFKLDCGYWHHRSRTSHPSDSLFKTEQSQNSSKQHCVMYLSAPYRATRELKSICLPHTVEEQGGWCYFHFIACHMCFLWSGTVWHSGRCKHLNPSIVQLLKPLKLPLRSN